MLKFQFRYLTKYLGYKVIGDDISGIFSNAKWWWWAKWVIWVNTTRGWLPPVGIIRQPEEEWPRLEWLPATIPTTIQCSPRSLECLLIFWALEDPEARECLLVLEQETRCFPKHKWRIRWSRRESAASPSCRQFNKSTGNQRGSRRICRHWGKWHYSRWKWG